MATETRSAADLVSALRSARDGLLTAVDGMPESEMTKPFADGWSVKDALAHISSWDELGAADIDRGARGHVPALMSFKDEEIDDWNAGLMRGRTAFTLPQVWHELEDRRVRLVETLKAAPEELVGGPLVARLCDVLIEHDALHAKEIREWRQKAGA